jgi:hypothetical protein
LKFYRDYVDIFEIIMKINDLERNRMKIKRDRRIMTQALELGLSTAAELATYIRALESAPANPCRLGTQA